MSDGVANLRFSCRTRNENVKSKIIEKENITISYQELDMLEILNLCMGFKIVYRRDDSRIRNSI